MSFRRVFWVVLDSVGIGEMPDAAAYGDAGSNTLGNIARQRPLRLPHFQALGLGNIAPLAGIAPEPAAVGSFGRCALASPGKDTTTGHWEMAGIHLDRPLPLYPHGFPPEIIDAFTRQTGYGVLGNKPASGTEIIRELGEQHLRTGKLIVYTSADSVFQIAAHEELVPVPALYRACEIAREILRGPHEVGRVIARPFIGQHGAFTRTANRHDFAIAPPAGMLLDRLQDSEIPVHSIGKIADVFLGRGIGSSVKTKSNADGMARTLEAMQDVDHGLVWVNLVDFDMLYGHRNDVEGYARALEECDAWLPLAMDALRPGDLLLLTADHGCDPTTPSTDHSREFTPVLAYAPGAKAAVDLGTRSTLSDIGQTVAHNFHTAISHGESFLEAIE
ncbi:MAG: phosphopentomutase [Bryobacterales bacterium]|jgi:phosphopentomutase|nr:phosphopentomutase [Bryobacterales bacterium]